MADFMGRFVIAARAGTDYGLFAERARPGGSAVSRRLGRRNAGDRRRRAQAGSPDARTPLLTPESPATHVRTAQDRHLERQRHPRPARRGAGVGAQGAPRRPLPAGDQGRTRPDPDVSLRARGLLVLLARREGVLGRGPARAQGARARAAGVRPSRVRLREPHRDRADAPGDRGVGLRAERRQGLSREDALPRGARRVRRRLPRRRAAARHLRRPERRAHRERRAPEGAQAAARSASGPRSARSSSASSATVSSTSAAPSIPTTTGSSRGGRRGATCASATSAGASTTSSPASPSSPPSAARPSNASSARAITRRWRRCLRCRNRRSGAQAFGEPSAQPVEAPSERLSPEPPSPDLTTIPKY